MNLNKYFHVLNPSRKNRRGVRRFFKKRSDLKSFLVDRQSHPKHLETIIDWALTEGKEKLAIWGGDGSFNRAIHKLYEVDALKKVSLILIPAGTCNDFARKIKLGTWEELVHKIEKGSFSQRRYDVGSLTAGPITRLFVNNAGFGRSREALQRKKSKPIEDIKAFKAHRIQVEWGGDKLHQYETFRVYLGMFFNSPFFNCGMHFSKSIEPDSGFMSGFFVPPQGGFKLFTKFLKSRFGGSLMDASTVKIEGKFINLESDTLLYPQVDGEPVTLDGVKSLKISTLKGALELIVPR